jgi:hypothetical protein
MLGRRVRKRRASVLGLHRDPRCFGIGVEANSKNTMLTAIPEDTIMLANARRSAIYLDLKCRGYMAKWSTLPAST